MNNNIQQVDEPFIKYTCKFCKKEMLYYEWKEHICDIDNKIDRKAIKCENCDKILIYTKNDEKNNILKAHIYECDYKKKNKKLKLDKCNNNKCLVKLNLTNRYKCKFCNLDFCLTHRLEFSHECIKKYKNKMENPIKIFFKKIFCSGN